MKASSFFVYALRDYKLSSCPHLAFSNLLTILAEFLATCMVLDVFSSVLTSYLLGGASLSLELRLLAWSATLAGMSNLTSLCGTEEFPKTSDFQD